MVDQEAIMQVIDSLYKANAPHHSKARSQPYIQRFHMFVRRG
jgi:hypothetical protein